MSEPSHTGGCQCGAVRFRFAAVRKAAICHCRMCQKAFGNYFAPLVMVDGLEWTRGQPSFFRSSNAARRGFCSSCGTPLCYIDDEGGIEIAGGALDAPELAPPTEQFNLRDKLSFVDTIAAIRHQPKPELEAAVNATIFSRQHPDHDTNVWPLPS